MSKFRKIILSILIASQLFISSGTLFISATHAESQNTWYNQGYTSWLNKVYDSNPQEIFGERYTAAQVQWIIYSLFTNVALLLIGGNQDILTCITGNLSTCVPGFQNLQASTHILKGPHSDKSFFAVLLEDRPISGITYIKDTVKKLNPVKEASAQTSPGFGFRGLSMIRDAWRVMRDITFGFFVLITIVFAFMIMFKVKISPQTVITVQSALPKLAITAILVTFSYAIAGFLVDIMYLVIGIISLFFSNLSIAGFVDTTLPADYFELLTKGPIVATTGGLQPEVHTGILGLLITYWLNFLVVGVISLFAQGVLFWSRIANLQIAGAVGGGIIETIGIIIGIIAFVIILVWLIIAIFKITFMLVRTFAMLLILTIFSPLFLLLGLVVPQFSFGRWLRLYASQLAVFPVVGFIFLLAFWFLGLALNVVVESVVRTIEQGALTQFIGGLVGQPANQETIRDFNAAFADGWPPLLGGMPETAGLILALASVAILFQATKAAQIVQSLVSGQAFNFGTAIQEATLGTAVNAVNIATAAGKIGQFYHDAFGQRTDPNVAPSPPGIAGVVRRYRERGGRQYPGSP